MYRIKHSIIVISYNQEKYISQTIESIINQSEMPYEIIICDDCSTDSTIDIINKLKKEYPDIINVIHNEKNLGIFANLNNSYQYVTGDFVNIIAGDDLLPEGILKEYSEYINSHHLNCSQPFLIVTDSNLFYSSGKHKRYNNNIVCTDGLMRSTIMCNLYFWETGMSRGLVEQLPKYRTNIGYQSDWLFHVMRAAIIKQTYYLNKIGYLYRVGVGVTASSKLKSLRDSRLYVIHEIYKLSLPLSQKEIRFLDFLETHLKYLNNSGTQLYFKMVWKRVLLGKVHRNNEFYRNWRIFIPRFIVTIFHRMLK